MKFNDKNIVFRQINGQYWIAVKSVCEALNINFNRQYQNIKTDFILKAVFAIQQMQVEGDQRRNMVCLPENYIYGWIFSINSNSEVLMIYKKQCYEMLFNHFHGIIEQQNRLKYISLFCRKKQTIKELESILRTITEYQELLNSKMREARLWKSLKQNTGMRDMFEQ